MHNIFFKYLLPVAIAVLLSTERVFAQFPEYAVGVRGGMQMSMALFEPSVAQSLPVSMHAGAQFRMVSEKYFGIIAELNYTQRGFSTLSGEGVYAHRRLDYIEIPFMSHITFGRKLFRYFIDLGPQVSFLISDTKPAVASTNPEHTLPAKNIVDYGLVFGTGFEFNTRYGVYTVDARYCFGLGNVFPSKASDHFKSSSNQNIQVCVAYLFPFR